MRRLTRAGFTTQFVRRAILPDWWETSCEDDTALLSDLEFRVARFLGETVTTVRSPGTVLAPAVVNASLRRVRSVDPSRLKPAIHAALQIARAVVRTLREPLREVRVPPADAVLWRSHLLGLTAEPDVTALIPDLWARGIPVVHVEVLPVPKFQGLACMLDNRPVILLGHGHDEPARVAFFVAHEAAHIVHGDCTPGEPVVDEEENVDDPARTEQRADRYAWSLLTGGIEVPSIQAASFKDVANAAASVEVRHGIDAGVVAWSWANRTRDFQTGALALKALYRAEGSRRVLRQHFDLNVDLDRSTEGDRALLSCVYGAPERDAVAR